MTTDERLAQERQAFLDRLQEDPTDLTTHLVFADWLEEHGYDDEALLHRGWTIDKHNDAMLFFMQMVEDIEAEDGDTNLTLEDLIDAGTEYLKSRITTTVGDSLPATADDPAYWDHWQILTGIPIAKEKRPGATPFDSDSSDWGCPGCGFEDDDFEDDDDGCAC